MITAAGMAQIRQASIFCIVYYSMNLIINFSFLTKLTYNINHFYRVALCVSMVPVVGHCLSVTLLYSVKTDISKILSWSGSPIIVSAVVSWSQVLLTNYKGNPSVGTLDRGWCEILQFLANVSVSRNWYKISLWLLWNINRKLWVADRSISVPMRPWVT